MKKLLLVLALVALTAVSFGQSITIVDNASTTVTDETERVFSSSNLPSDYSLDVDGASYTGVLIPQNAVRFTEVASTTDIVAPQVPGYVTFQFNTASKTLYIRLMDSDGADWGGVATLSADMLEPLN